MSSFKPLRILLIAILVLLAVQYEFGMAVNIANPASIPAFSFNAAGILAALQQAGAPAVIHAFLGAALVLLALANAIVSLRTQNRAAQILGVVSFLTMCFAAYGGVWFVLSGFQDDHATHDMATNFILSFTLFFLELYAIKAAPAPRPETT